MTDIEDSERISPFLKRLMKLCPSNDYQCQLTSPIEIPRNCIPHEASIQHQLWRTLAKISHLNVMDHHDIISNIQGTEECIA